MKRLVSILAMVVLVNVSFTMVSMEAKNDERYISIDRINKKAQPDNLIYDIGVFRDLFNKVLPSLGSQLISGKVMIQDFPVLQRFYVERKLSADPLTTYLIYNENRKMARPIIQFVTEKNKLTIILDHDSMMKNLFPN